MTTTHETGPMRISLPWFLLTLTEVLECTRRALTLLLCMLLSTMSIAVTAEGDPAALVQATTGELFARVHNQRDALRADPDAVIPLVEQMLLPHVDLERTSRLVLGKHWRSANQEQRERFMDEFRALLLRTYSTAFIEFTNVDIGYLETRYSEDGHTAVVRSRVRFPDGRPEVPIDYRLALVGEAWKVFDVMVGGISLVTTYRSSFGDEVARRGIDGLLRSLHEHNRGGGQGV